MSHVCEILYSILNCFTLDCADMKFAWMTGTIVSITIPALYNKYEVHVDRYAGLVHQKFTKHYRVVDENVIRRLPRRFSKNKDA